MVYLVNGSFWGTGNYLITVGFGFLITIILANFVPKETLGTYQFILAVAGILAVCTLSGMGTAITKAVSQGKDGAYRYGAAQKLKWSSLIFVLSTVIGFYYFSNNNSALGVSFLIVGITTPFIESFKLYEDYLKGKEAFKELLTLGFWRKPIPLLTVGVSAVLSNDFTILLVSYFGGHLISYGIVYLQVHKKFKPGNQVDIDTIRLSKHLSVIRLLSQITSNLDKILLWHFLGPLAVASFSIAQISSRYASGVFNNIATIALPKVSKQDFRELQKTLPRKVGIFSIAMFVVALIYVALIPIIFQLVFPEYPESILIAQLLAVLFVLAPSKIFSQALVVHDQMRSQYKITIISYSVFAVLLWILIPRFEILGAAAAVIISSLVAAVLNYVIFINAKTES
jgi:O-antigen/teichoic acid export membrane protein